MLDPQTIELLRQFGVDPAQAETLLYWSVVLTVVAVVAAIPTVFIAARKRRSRVLWLLFALTVPVVPLLWVWLLPDLPADPAAKP